MVKILFYHTVHDLFPLFVEIQGKVVFGLALPPHVKRFVPDEHSQTIARFKHFFRAGMMGNPNRVKPRVLEYANSPFAGVVILAGPDYSVVMVNTRAAKEYVIAVYPKAVYGIDTNFPHAER